MRLDRYIVIRTAVDITVLFIGTDIFNDIFTYCQNVIVKGLRRIMVIVIAVNLLCLLVSFLMMFQVVLILFVYLLI